MDIYVGNLPYSTDEEELSELAGQFGEVTRAVLIQDRETRRSRGFGFITMPNDNEARKAIEELNEKEHGGRTLVVNEARPREPRTPRNDY